MPKGFLAFHLHAHLPYIRHPEHAEFLEERWLFDAIVDTYAPLLTRFESLASEGIPFRLSMTLSPTLLSMFADKLLQERFERHLEKQQQLCAKELDRTADDPNINSVVRMYLDRLNMVRMQFKQNSGNLAHAFKGLACKGFLELTTCGATHGFLPHMQLVPGAVARQLRLAVETHQRILDIVPAGIWLPECGYYPGLETQLLDHGLLYFFVDTHALELGLPRSMRSVYSHVYMPNGVAAFARDYESSKQVWSAKEGYPGDGLYRDFYRDIGFDQPIEYVAPYVHLGDTPILTGFKYHRITGETEHKEIYDPQAASRKAEEHARHFVWCREHQINWLNTQLDRPPVIVAPYDAELFGHWWFEGPDFLYHVFKAAAENPVIETIAARDYMIKFPTAQLVVPNSSTWGDGGFNSVWLNQSNEWIYPHLNAAARMMDSVTPALMECNKRGFRQLERELVLAQSSDWGFIMTTGTSPGYASYRTVQHLRNLHRLRKLIADSDEPALLEELEACNNVFQQ